ncbi:hypothetical protein F5X96DRAFT_694820 [Biscogniauxia mediterranea]|nr:hypothetical protein F5X96DRAFT_694820 [Biscogniauxia mediterranea]
MAPGGPPLQSKTSRYLFNSTSAPPRSFLPDVICGSQQGGLYMYTASSGRRVLLDWTSGQIWGTGHPEIVRTIADHAADHDHRGTAPRGPTDPRGRVRVDAGDDADAAVNWNWCDE